MEFIESHQAGVRIMSIAKKYLSLEEAAAVLKVKTDELIRLREKGDIRGFADRGTWKFKSDDVDEFRRRHQPDSDPDLPIFDDHSMGENMMSDPDLQTFRSSDSAIDDDDDEIGRQPTVIRKGVSSGSDSDVRLVLDDDLKSQLTGSSGEMPVIDLSQSDSDVRLVGDPVARQKSDSDSDVQLLDSSDPMSDSDSDVLLIDSASSDSDVRLALLDDSDSDVKLFSDGSGAKLRGRSELDKTLGSDSDVALLPTLDSTEKFDLRSAPKTHELDTTDAGSEAPLSLDF
ncbi:MAG: helix-turn-helix domain-containing protein, partial [Planctomycetes bacterium]|nr:helix-turn-helix domain-containing protein [Planctomycetota bacterium]